MNIGRDYTITKQTLSIFFLPNGFVRKFPSLSILKSKSLRLKLTRLSPSLCLASCARISGFTLYSSRITANHITFKMMMGMRSSISSSLKYSVESWRLSRTCAGRKLRSLWEKWQRDWNANLSFQKSLHWWLERRRALAGWRNTKARTRRASTKLMLICLQSTWALGKAFINSNHSFFWISPTRFISGISFDKFLGLKPSFSPKSKFG